MFQINALSLGIIMVGVGLVFLLATRLLVRMVPRLKPAPSVNNLPRIGESPIGKHNDSILVIQPGGRLVFINEQARKLFNVTEGEVPNLERIARRARPMEAFLNLCANEGQVRFALDGKPLDGTSYRISLQFEGAMVVSLRHQVIYTEADGSPSWAVATQTLQTYIELTQTMATSLKLDESIQAVLECVDRMIPGDFLEISIWDSELQVLQPYRFVGFRGGDRRLETSREVYHLGEGYAGYIAQEKQPLLVPNLESIPGMASSNDFNVIPVRSFIGIPLIVGQEFIGTLELGSLVPDSFQAEDLEVLKLLSGQASMALHNAIMYRKEQRRANELAGLAQLTQALSSTRDPQGLFGNLVQSIIPLIKVEVLGFLLYNDTNHALEGQVPFYGLPPQFIEIYKVSFVPDSLLEKTFLDQNLILTENAAEDPQWAALGLDHLAQAASLRETVMIPLTSGGKMLGFLQASNHVDGGLSFSLDELHLLTIIANQVAPIIDNATLMQQSRQRAQRAEALRRIASLVTSAATVDEILKFSLQELARLLDAEVAGALLIDPDSGVIHFHRPSYCGDNNRSWDAQIVLPVDDPQFPFTITGSQHAAMLEKEASDHPIIPFYQNIFNTWQISSAVVVPLVVRDEGIGELWLGSSTPNFFVNADVQVVSTAAGQLASVVEQVKLSTQTDESLRRRVDHLTAVTRISRELSTSLDLPSVLKLVFDEAVKTTKADCGSIVLFDSARVEDAPAVIRYSVGEGKKTLTPLEARIVDQGESLYIPDFQKSEYSSPHEGIEAALYVPVRYHQHKAGLISLHARSANRFDESALEITQLLASQAAVALGNAQQFEGQVQQSDSLQHQLDTMNKLFQVFQNMRANQPLEENLNFIARAIQETTPFQVVLISAFDAQIGALRRITSQGMLADVWEQLHRQTQPWSAIQSLLIPKFKIGVAYYIPADNLPYIQEDVHSVQVISPTSDQIKGNWQPDDFLLVPLFDSSGVPLGLISLDAPNDGRAPDRVTVEALELFAQQARLTIEHNYQINALQAHLEIIEENYARADRALASARANLPMLLHRQVEQTLTHQQMKSQSLQVRAAMDILALASQQSDVDQLLNAVARELLTRFDFHSALIAEITAAGPHLLDVIGKASHGSRVETLFGQRNPLRQMLEDHRLVMISDIEQDQTWQKNPMMATLEGRAILGFPITISEGHTAGILALSSHPAAAVTDEEHQVYVLLARQLEFAAKNMQFLKDTRRRLEEVDLLLAFTRRLGSLDPQNILQTLVDTILQLIPEAKAVWAGVWDRKSPFLAPQSVAGYIDNASLLKVTFELGADISTLPARVFRNGQARRVDEVNFTQDYSLVQDNLLNYRKATGGRLPISSMLVPLGLGEKQLGLLVLENFSTPGVFSQDEEALTLSLAQQTALALENARLYVAAEDRANQLQALTRVAGTITSSLKSDELIESLLDQLHPVLNYDTAILWLRTGSQLTVAAASGFTDNERRVGLSVAVEDSLLFQEMIQTGQAVSVADIRQDDRFPKLIEPDHLSWLAIPLISKSEVIGAIALEKTQAEYFSQEHIQAATTFASQAAIALENSRLFEESVNRAAELDQRSQRLALLNRFSSDLGGHLDVTKVLELTGQQLMDAFKPSRVAAVMLGDKGEALLQVEIPGVGAVLPMALPAIPWFERLKESRGIYNAANVNDEYDLRALVTTYFAARQVVSLLAIPLQTGANIYGWIWLENNEQYHYSLPELELVRTICNQAAIAAQNARLFAETRRLTEDLERRVEERTAEMMREHQNTETLLNIITELSSSLDLGQVLTRTLMILNQSLGSEQSVILLANHSTQYTAGMSLAGVKSGDQKDESLRIEKGIARWITRHRSPALVDDILTDGRWEFGPEEQPIYKSVIAVSLVIGEESMGTLLMLHRQPSFFMIEQVGMVEAVARQFSITLNNSELFNLIRDQAENLGSMLRDKQIEASRSRAILEAVADGVLVTDETNLITLFNVSAQRILGLKSDQVVSNSLDQFAGLFGKASLSWFLTIREWSADPKAYQGDIYSEQITLDNNRVVSVHLAPVIYRTEFLGTVSVFRDITHEVQVDRLKSEFVANVSHELRTPMTSIKGYVDIMLMGAAGVISPQQKHFLEVVRSNTERLSVLVNDLLDISRIEAGQVTLSVSELNLGEIAEDVEQDLRRRALEENKPMSFVREIPADLPRVKGDPDRIRQVLGNLVTNGYNYTPAHGMVTVRMICLGQSVQIDVIDNGIGISLKDQKRIFERFYRGEDPLVLATSGTGLGLALSRTLVEMHHGQIWYNSSGIPGKGSTFSFTLPVVETKE